MKIFISYASEDRDVAEKVDLALFGAGHHTFFDRESLPPGGDYHGKISLEIKESDAFVFLISPESILSGSYALTELKQAKAKWKHPKGFVLPVLVKKVSIDIPPYLQAVTILEPEGNIPAEVIIAIANLPEQRTIAQNGNSDKGSNNSKKSLMQLVTAILVIVTVLLVENVDKIWSTISERSGGEKMEEKRNAVIITKENLIATAKAVEAESERSVDEVQKKEASLAAKDLQRAAIVLTTPVTFGSSPNSTPKWLMIALSELGQQELPGDEHNPRILKYIESVSLDSARSGDELPWTSFFVNWVFSQVGIQGTNSGVARSWLQWGKELDAPIPGTVVVFSRGDRAIGAGHVGFFLSDAGDFVVCISGNVGNAVRISAFPKSKVLGYRWPANA